MNQRQIGTILIIVGIMLAVFTYIAKVREDFYIEAFESEHKSCYLDDGTCLHKDRDFMLYILGGILSASLILLGIYLVFFDRTEKMLAEQGEKVVSALKEAKQKDEFSAYLSAFPEDEKKILKAVHEQDGIQQSTLRYRSGMSKTGLSIMLKSLEERDIISRKKSGKTNNVYLRKRF